VGAVVIGTPRGANASVWHAGNLGGQAALLPHRQCASKCAWLTQAMRHCHPTLDSRATAGEQRRRYIGDGGHDEIIPQASHWRAVGQ